MARWVFSMLHFGVQISREIAQIAHRCLRTARSTSSEYAFLLRRLATKHLYRGDKCCISSVCPSVCLSSAYDLLKIGMT